MDTVARAARPDRDRSGALAQVAEKAESLEKDLEGVLEQINELERVLIGVPISKVPNAPVAPNSPRPDVFVHRADYALSRGYDALNDIRSVITRITEAL